MVVIVIIIIPVIAAHLLPLGSHCSANKLLGGNKRRTSPLLMESLFFLRQNRRYWDIGVVQKAFQGTCSANVKNNMAEDE